MGRIMYLFKKLFDILRLPFAFMHDYRHYAYTQSKANERLVWERKILLLAHALEKGMSFRNKRKNWGEEKALDLCKLINKYNDKYHYLDFPLGLAVNALNAYQHDNEASKSPVLLNHINNIINDWKSADECIYPSGVTPISQPAPFDQTEINRFFESRRSVRFYNDQPITEEEIRYAIAVASHTPTACNRQTSHVYAFRDKTTIKQILDIQLGDQGWCSGADTLFVVTGNMSYFGGVYERHQVYIDGGLYAMNLVYGLHLQRIGTCYKMFVREPSIMDKFRKTCGIPRNETPIVLIFAGHYDDKQNLGPMSHRFSSTFTLDGKTFKC